MARVHLIAGASEKPVHPDVRKIGIADLKAALAEGFDDFKAMPTHVVFVGLLYPILGLFLAGMAFEYNVLPLLFPLMSGFALVGPVAAVGLYELSRRRELGLDTSWRHAFDVLQSPAIGSIALLGIVLLVIFVAWLLSAQALYQSLFGYRSPPTLTHFAQEVLRTPEGRTLMAAGNLIGFVFALVTLVISAISFPLLVDRDVGAAVAIQTSVRAVAKNPVTMAVWGLIVALALAVGSIPLFVGLAVAVPVLGHSTWHLYRRLVPN